MRALPRRATDSALAPYAAVAAAIAVQLVVLYAPSPPGGPMVPHLDKLVHALVFGAVAWTARRADLPAGPVIGLLLLHAVLSEVAQEELLAGRSGDPGDSLADAAGTLLGAALPTRRGTRAA